MIVLDQSGCAYVISLYVAPVAPPDQPGYSDPEHPTVIPRSVVDDNLYGR